VQQCLAAGSLEKLRPAGLPQERYDVFPGGLAIIAEIFAMLGVKRMTVADGALREGLLYDLLGRFTDEDARARCVRAMEARYAVDTAQADRVEATVLGFLRQVRSEWRLEEPLAELSLRWAARLHEIGLTISYSGYHKHGAYLVENADLAGFSRQDRHQLALLIRCQRHTLRPELLAGLPGERMLAMRSLLPPLRIALCLHRDRSPRKPVLPELRYAGSRVRLVFPDGWLAEHPLTRTDFEEERALLAPMGIVLEVK